MVSHPHREHTYRPAWWVPGPHAQTLWGKFARSTPSLPTRLERWSTPDNDFVDVLRLDAGPERPRLFLLHGLEGTVRSHYVGGLLHMAHERDWGADMLIFRGCGAEQNRAARLYHSGETGDLSFAVSRVLEEFPAATNAICYERCVAKPRRSWRDFLDFSIRRRCPGRARFTSSITWLPPRCTDFATPTTTTVVRARFDFSIAFVGRHCY